MHKEKYFGKYQKTCFDILYLYIYTLTFQKKYSTSEYDIGRKLKNIK